MNCLVPDIFINESRSDSQVKKHYCDKKWTKSFLYEVGIIMY